MTNDMSALEALEILENDFVKPGECRCTGFIDRERYLKLMEIIKNLINLPACPKCKTKPDYANELITCDECDFQYRPSELIEKARRVRNHLESIDEHIEDLKAERRQVSKELEELEQLGLQ